MDLKKDVKPITYLKNRTADVVREVTEGGRTMMITQNGEAKVVVMDVETYDRWRSAMALLKILAHAETDVDSGRTVKQEQAFDRTLGSLKGNMKLPLEKNQAS
ncbi:MAG TPA: type II toxin-antitoxin system Phd/YefM family antitoxin [Acidobacteriota bacterium]|nr:type II toxin-antitoxin system Phd/YefM family antitoxin [Acidobacteriota bacterium]